MLEKPDYGDEKKLPKEWADIYEIGIDESQWEPAPITQVEWESRLQYRSVSIQITQKQKIKPCSFYRSW